MTNGQSFPLHSGSLLALFIYEQIYLLGNIREQQSTRLRLVEPITITDEFSTWSYDHFRDLFEIELRPHLEESFPSCWTLNNQTSIHCRFIRFGIRQNDEPNTSSIPDRPRTSTLEQFVYDVCAKDGNDKAKKWYDTLCIEDIRTFTHLSNLKQTEWDNIKKLSMNAKRILKAAVDRERENVADDRRRGFEESLPGEDLPKLTGN